MKFRFSNDPDLQDWALRKIEADLGRYAVFVLPHSDMKKDLLNLLARLKIEGLNRLHETLTKDFEEPYQNDNARRVSGNMPPLPPSNNVVFYLKMRDFIAKRLKRLEGLSLDQQLADLKERILHAPQPDLRQCTEKELRALATETGYSVHPTMTRADLLSLLKIVHDEEAEGPLETKPDPKLKEKTAGSGAGDEGGKDPEIAGSARVDLDALDREMGSEGAEEDLP